MHTNIHKNQPVLKIGTDLQNANLIVILLHGRGANAQSMVPLAKALNIEGIHFKIPQAGLNRWYPNTAFGPLDANEPDLSSALNVISSLISEVKEIGFSDQQIAIGGFSQGACLASEYIARNPAQFAGLFVISGALIGPPGMERNYSGSFDDMPVFIGGSDVDPWIQHDFMVDTAKVYTEMGAKVDFCTYPGMAHTINEDEINAVRELFQKSIQTVDGQR